MVANDHTAVDNRSSLVVLAVRSVAANPPRQLPEHSGSVRFVIRPVNSWNLVRNMNQLLDLPASGKVTVGYALSDSLPFIPGNEQHVVMSLMLNTVYVNDS